MSEEKIRIGHNVEIGEGTIIGAMPLMLKVVGGRRERIEIKGGIVIENNVDIGANCVINCGVDGDTTIKEGVFVGHLSNIGHDVVVGNNSVIGVHVCVGGRVRIGNWCYIAQGSVIRPEVTIGDYTMIGMGSIVIKDLPERVIAYGSPCKPVKKNEWTE